MQEATDFKVFNFYQNWTNPIGFSTVLGGKDSLEILSQLLPNTCWTFNFNPKSNDFSDEAHTSYLQYILWIYSLNLKKFGENGQNRHHI